MCLWLCAWGGKRETLHAGVGGVSMAAERRRKRRRRGEEGEEAKGVCCSQPHNAYPAYQVDCIFKVQTLGQHKEEMLVVALRRLANHCLSASFLSMPTVH